MEKSIYSFPEHILEALDLKNDNIFNTDILFSSVIIAGQGGSAIGGFIISDLLNLNNYNVFDSIILLKFSIIYNYIWYIIYFIKNNILHVDFLNQKMILQLKLV